MGIANDVQKLDLGAICDFYILDLTEIGGVEVLYFHPGVNGLGVSVTWQGVVYTEWPMTAKGYQLSGKGPLPRPTITVANLDGSIGTMCKTYQDMVKAKITRKRTLGKYLDAVNFPGGVNASANPGEYFRDEVYFIERKTNQDDVWVTFECTASWDVVGVRLPRRQIVQNACPHLYRGPDCGYTGPYIDIHGLPTANAAEDRCSKRMGDGCKPRFGTDPAGMPFGAFPLVLVS